MSCLEKGTLTNINGTKLFYYMVGKNHPPLVVLHGGPGLGCHYLLPQMMAIGDFCCAIFYDQRGTGQSIDAGINSWKAEPFQTYLQDLEALRNKFAFETISLLAHSWGSILASLYATAYPDRVNKIIYLNPVPVSSQDYLEFVKHRSQIVDTHKNELTLIRESKLFQKGDPQTVEKFYRIYFKNYFAKPEYEKMLSLTMTSQAAINNFKIYDLFYNDTVENAFDFYQALKNINKKSLIIAGDKDVIPFSYVEKLNMHIPASKLVLLKNCGHFPYIDQAEILFETIKLFMKEKYLS